MPNLAGFETRTRGHTTLIRQAITHRRVIYGEMRVSGPLVFYESTDDNQYHHLVIALADHEVDAIETVFLGEDAIFDADLDGSGNVTAGKYNGKVRIKKHLGAAGQTADADLIAEVDGLDSNFKGVGQAYLYVRTETDRDIFPSVIPQNISARVRGKKFYDPRDAGTRWSPNAALALRDFIVTARYGYGGTTDSTYDTAAANTCDEIVDTKTVSHTAVAVPADDVLTLDGDRLKFQTGDRLDMTTTDTLPAPLAVDTDYYVIVVREVSSDTQSVAIKVATSYANALAGTAVDITDTGAGTHTATKDGEPRYTVNGVIDTGRKLNDTLNELRQAMAGRLVPPPPSWRIHAGAWAAASLTFDESDMRGPIRRRGRHPRRERFNAVKGIYVSPLNAGQAADYPPVTNSTYETEDNGVQVFKELDLPYTSRPQTAQRIATIELHRHRRETTLEQRFSFSAFQIEAADVIDLDNTKRSWTGEEFECVLWSMVPIETDGGQALVIDTTLRSTASTVYDYDESAEETQVDPAPSQSPLDPTTVANPTALTLASGTAQLDKRLDGTVFSRIKASWTAPADKYVTSGGQIEIQYKKSADSDWIPFGFADGAVTFAYILDVADGVDYDVRIRAVNQLGIRASAWVTESDHTVIGKTEPPADLTSFMIAGSVLSWVGPDAEVDMAGYEIRFHYGVNRDWDTASAMHTGLLQASPYTMEVVPPGSVTIMAKARDTSGNYSTNAAVIITNLGDSPVANVVESFPQATDWTGTLTNGTITGGTIAADEVGVTFWTGDGNLMWTGDGNLMWVAVTYEAMTYTFSITPSAAGTGSTLTVLLTATGDVHHLEYRQASTDMWSGSDTALMWLGDALLMWVFHSYQSWPGSITVENEQIDFRATTDAGSTQGVFSVLTPQIDMPDLEENLDDVELDAAGSRLSLTESFTAIVSVLLTLQDDAGSARTVKVMDKNVALGPLVQGFDSTGTGTSATVDARVKGY